ncbi:histidine kinase [Kouleothrix aurantiaca]|uniref:Histidine kinase n=1 Tax=Kouleothrix aurantiaca TaxID=186479 RepID=A0A0P9F5P6_9CHLR|nr:histidine kinase [Kouleothrix aurantiaca]
MAPSETQQKLEELHQTIGADLEKTRRELGEMETLLRQTTAEVEKLAQREMTVANRLRDLEVNLDKYSKADIKNFYTSAQEVQMRLLMMRGQLEQLQFRQQLLKGRQSQLFEIVSALEPVVGADMGSGPRGGSDEGTDLIAAIIQAQENERLRISLQMHDGPAQSMSNLVLRAEICQRLLDRDTEQTRGELVALKGAINTTLQDTRRFIFDLRPMILDDLGLVPTLRRYVQQFSEKNKIEVNLMVQNMDARLPSHYEVALFRFIQEALNNVARHASASQARVLLDQNNGSIHVSIEDDGTGFHVNEVLSEESGRRNLGIETLRQQVESLLRGEFGIESSVGRGTRVAGVVPVP